MQPKKWFFFFFIISLSRTNSAKSYWKAKRKKCFEIKVTISGLCVTHFSTLIIRLIWLENGTFFWKKRKKFSFVFLPTVRKISPTLQKYEINFHFLEKKKTAEIFFSWKRPKFWNHSFCSFLSKSSSSLHLQKMRLMLLLLLLMLLLLLLLLFKSTFKIYNPS